MTSLRVQSLKSIARKATLINFLARESPSSLAAISSSSTSTVPSPFVSLTNPFSPTKTTGANSFTAPKYSLRRQKLLRQQAEALGWPTNTLPPPHVNSISPTAKAKRPVLLFRESPSVPATKVLTALKLQKMGPYAGRKGPAFKGKMWERKMGARVEELRVALEATGLKEATWRKTKAEEKAKGRPALPF